MESRVLAALPKPGMYPSNSEGEVNDSSMDAIIERLVAELEMDTPQGRSLVDGSISRLSMLSLCETTMTFGGKLAPRQRSVHGDIVLSRIQTTESD